jgi:hypothetical protein
VLHRVYIKYKTVEVMFPIKIVYLKYVKSTAVLKFQYLTVSCCDTLCFAQHSCRHCCTVIFSSLQQ